MRGREDEAFGLGCEAEAIGLEREDEGSEVDGVVDGVAPLEDGASEVAGVPPLEGVRFTASSSKYGGEAVLRDD